jgi:hypothetical protein
MFRGILARSISRPQKFLGLISTRHFSVFQKISRRKSSSSRFDSRALGSLVSLKPPMFIVVSGIHENF